jgi:hypothetical protein
MRLGNVEPPVLSQISLNPQCVFDFRVSCGGPNVGNRLTGPPALVATLRVPSRGPGASLRPTWGLVPFTSGVLGGAAVGDLVRLDYVA